MARALGLETVAEGVETVEQLARLQALDVDVVQGYLYSRPVAAAELPDAIDAIERDAASAAAPDARRAA